MHQLKISVAFTAKAKNGIGKDGKLPWHIKEDLQSFAGLTKGQAVVMGMNTWNSLPQKPLAGRTNIVLVADKQKVITTSWNDHVFFFDEIEFTEFCKSWRDPIWIIGGASLYAKYMGVAPEVYATIIEKEYDCDVHFPIENFHKYVINTYTPLKYSEEEKCNFRYITYTLSTNRHQTEQVYLDHVRRVLIEGEKRPDRTNTGTLSVFGAHLKFDIASGFPLLTTKHVPFKAIIHELLFFLRGETDSKVLERQGVNIWKANTTRDFLDSRGLREYEVGDMGPMYGFNWRFFGTPYEGCGKDYRGRGYDQFTKLIEGLKTDPYSRRHMLTTYNPAAVDESVLAPCHGIVVQFYVAEGNRLSCCVYIRSSDTFLGLPFNIASYAALTYLIAKICDLQPYHLIISIGDAHIYQNHLQQMQEQVQRHPYPFPRLEVHESVKTKALEDITVNDFNLVGYLSHPAIKGAMAI
jgi:dihydrofolate reductase/thymidylate synthase